MVDWSARQYLKFEDERTRPARDLLAQVPLEAARLVCDLGCGPGNSTELLVRRFAHATVIGVDSSPGMLRQAGSRLSDCTFIAADLSDWVPPEDADLLFSNATFQWVPDHVAVLRRLLASLRTGGVFAIQIPDNFEEPTHALIREVARSGPWAGYLAEMGPDRASPPPVGVYYDQLRPLCTKLDLWHTIYHHQLDGAPAIVEWLRGSGLRPYLDPLPEDQRAAFIDAYTARIAATYPPQADGKVLLRFPRLFMVAVK